MKQKVIVYIDGFNFYYGLKHSMEWRRFYWLDIVSLFEKFMRDNQELVAVKYFSARPTNLEKSANQNAFFQANLQNPKFRLLLGKYLKKEITCFKCGNIIHTYEEKETDVRVATQIVSDAYEQEYDVAIVVSADSDMVPAIELAKKIGKKVYIYFPPNQHSNNLSTAGSASPIYMRRYESRFRQCILPDTIQLPDGFILEIPPKWKQYQNKVQ